VLARYATLEQAFLAITGELASAAEPGR
jgi:hypothetical protein